MSKRHNNRRQIKKSVKQAAALALYGNKYAKMTYKLGGRKRGSVSNAFDAFFA